MPTDKPTAKAVAVVAFKLAEGFSKLVIYRIFVPRYSVVSVSILVAHVLEMLMDNSEQAYTQALIAAAFDLEAR